VPLDSLHEPELIDILDNSLFDVKRLSLELVTREDQGEVAFSEALGTESDERVDVAEVLTGESAVATPHP
jgi:hypothetical protein